MGCLGSIRIDLSDKLEDPGDSWCLQGHVEADRYMLGDKELHLPNGVDYDMMFTNAGDGILATGIVRADVEGSCDRCLDRASFEIAGEVEEYYLFSAPDDPEAYEDGFELIGETRCIDLSGALSDALVMDTPFVVLCRPDCAGLCPVCGCNLNQKDCGCRADAERVRAGAENNPFAALRDLKFDV